MGGRPRPPRPQPPLTLAELWRALPRSPTGRLAAAQALAEDPAPVLDALLAEVQALEGFDRSGEPFHHAPDRLSADLEAIAHGERAPRTADLAAWLGRERWLAVPGDPQLEARLVDREIVPTRAAGRARGRSGALRVDLLLAGPAGVPVVAEVKIGRDGDPFSALLQALAGAAQLATPAQGARLTAAHPSLAGAPPLDALVLCVDTPWTATRVELLAAAKELAHAVCADRRLAPIVRRAALVELRRAPGELWGPGRRL